MTKKAKIELIIKILLILVFVPVGVVSLAEVKTDQWNQTAGEGTTKGNPFGEEIKFMYKENYDSSKDSKRYGNENDTYSGVKNDFANRIKDEGDDTGFLSREKTFSISGLYNRYARLFYMEQGQENDVEKVAGYEHDIIFNGVDYGGIFEDWVNNRDKRSEDIQEGLFTKETYGTNINNATENYKKELIWKGLTEALREIEGKTEDYIYIQNLNVVKNKKVDFNNFYGINILEDVGTTSSDGGATLYNKSELIKKIKSILREKHYKNKLLNIEINPLAPKATSEAIFGDNSEETVNLANFYLKDQYRNLAYAFSFFDTNLFQKDPNYSQQVLTEYLFSGKGLIEIWGNKNRNSII